MAACRLCRSIAAAPPVHVGEALAGRHLSGRLSGRRGVHIDAHPAPAEKPVEHQRDHDHGAEHAVGGQHLGRGQGVTREVRVERHDQHEPEERHQAHQLLEQLEQQRHHSLLFSFSDSPQRLGHS